MTKSIAYPDADLSCGLSTTDFLICGDQQSIDRVKDALHAQQEIVPYLRQQIPRNIEAAARKLAHEMDYPWEYMTPDGHENMRKIVRAVIEASCRD